MTAVAALHAPAALGGTDADLVKAAAAGDGEAFADLYRRHAQTGWRLAHAVALSPADAEGSLTEGFARALRGVRRRRVAPSEPFRPLLLKGVYLAAADRLAAPGQPVASTAPGRSGDALTSAAFRSLPDRWRAALWMAEVEGMSPQAIAPVMGVSTAVGAQLVARGGRGLADRFRQAGTPLPHPLAPALRALAPPLSSSVAAGALAASQAAVAADGGYRLAPAFAWLNERATRPLGVTVGGILALGLIGLGVVSQHGGLDTFGPAALGSGPAAAGTIRIRSAGVAQTLRPTAPNGSSLLLGLGGPSTNPGYITVGEAGSFGSAAASSAATSGSSVVRPAHKAASASRTPATTTAPGTLSTPPTTTSAGTGGSSSSATTTTTTTIPLPTLPPTTLGPIAVTPTGVQVSVPGIVSVGLATPTTTTKPKSTTTTTTAPTSAPTTVCVLGVVCLGLG